MTSIGYMARVAENAGADAISLINTFVAMAIDAKTRKPHIANVTAGLSGPAIKPIALRMVYEVSKSGDDSVIGMGEISKAEDIIEFILAGATAVEIGPPATGIPAPPNESWTNYSSGVLENRVQRLAEPTGGLVME